MYERASRVEGDGIDAIGLAMPQQRAIAPVHGEQAFVASGEEEGHAIVRALMQDGAADLVLERVFPPDAAGLAIQRDQAAASIADENRVLRDQGHGARLLRRERVRPFQGEIRDVSGVDARPRGALMARIARIHAPAYGVDALETGRREGFGTGGGRGHRRQRGNRGERPQRTSPPCHRSVRATIQSRMPSRTAGAMVSSSVPYSFGSPETAV